MVRVNSHYLLGLLSKTKDKLAPGLFSFPLVGNLPQIYCQKIPLYKYCQELSKQLGTVISLDFGVQTTVLINRIDETLEAFVKKQNEFAGRPKSWTVEKFSEGYKDIFAGMFTSTWRVQRKLGHSAFRHFASRDVLVQRIHDSFNNIAAVIDDLDETKFNPREYVYNTMYNIIHDMTFGKCFDFSDEQFKKLRRATDRLNEVVISGFTPDYIPFFRYLPRTSAQKEFLDLMKCILEYVYNQYNEHVKTINKDDPRDICDDLILAREEASREEVAELTDTHIAQTCLDVFSAGTDTTSMTLLWAFLFMAGYQDVQQKVQEELDSVVGHNRFPNYDKDKPRLPYCDAVMHEVMRIKPLVPLIFPHVTTADTSVGGFALPKDTLVMVNLYNLHHDPENWDEPEKFKPERFLDDDGKISAKIPSFMPFSAGRRVCLGESIAKVNLFVVFACFLQRYSLSMPPGETANFEEKEQPLLIEARPYNIIMKKRF